MLSGHKHVGLGVRAQVRWARGCAPAQGGVRVHAQHQLGVSSPARLGMLCPVRGRSPSLVCGLRILLEPMLLRYFLCFYRFLLFYVGICLPHLFFDSSYMFKKVRLFYLYVLLLYLITAVHVMSTTSYHKLAFIIKKMIYK